MKLVGGQNSSIVYEKSVVDLEGRRLVLKSTNLTYSHLLTVEETCIYEAFSSAEGSVVSDNIAVNVAGTNATYGTAADSSIPSNTSTSLNWTKFTQEARITSFSAWNYLRDSLEDFSIARFQANAHKGRAALETVLNDLINDTRDLFKEKFGEFGEDVDNFIKLRDDPKVQDEATSMAEEAIVEQE